MFRRTVVPIVLAAALFSPLTACSATRPAEGTRMTPAPAATTAPDPSPVGPPRATPGVQPVPDGWTVVTEPDSGVTLQLPETAQREVGNMTIAGVPASAVVYTAPDAVRHVVTTFLAAPLPAGANVELQDVGEDAAQFVDGRVVQATPTIVGGYDALDIRIEGVLRGAPVVNLHRVVATPTHLVAVDTLGEATGEPTVQQMHNQLLVGLQLPAA